jgi:GNAT superfamily N-acetyltransferase
MSLVYKQVSKPEELDAILALQQKYHKDTLNPDEKAADGFLTIRHSREWLQQMHDLVPSVIAVEGNELAGYALVMSAECRRLIPALEPMFAQFDLIRYGGRPLSDYNYYVIGQICVAAEYRGKGVFDGLYTKHRELFSSRFDFAVTEISTSNGRSLRAHERAGFEVVHRHKDSTDDWVVVLLKF